MCDVVLPARNVANTIEDIIDVLHSHPSIGQVIVSIDMDTTDLTMKAAKTSDVLIATNAGGKGQCVMEGLRRVTSPWVLFMDSDIRGLTYDHIGLLIADAVAGNPDRMTIGVPDVPYNYPSTRLWAWAWVSGQRCLPMRIIRDLNLHGYLMETQINRAAKNAGIPLNFEWLQGLTSEYIMDERRLREMDRDAQWGRTHGLL